MGGNFLFGPTRPVIIGHRGCGRGIVDGCVENTVESFLTAVELGVEWLEVDVRRTADDILVVAHDPAEPDGVFYADMTSDEACERGTLRLEELLDALPADVGVDLDLKTSMEDATRERTATTAGQLAPVAEREARRRPLLVTSFDPGALDITRELTPGVPRGLLTWLDFPIGQAVAAAGHLDVQVLASHCGSLRPNSAEPEPSRRPLEYVVDIVHQSGREFLAWCPGPGFAEALIEAGADALCVNNVGKVLATLSTAVGATEWRARLAWTRRMRSSAVGDPKGARAGSGFGLDPSQEVPCGDGLAPDHDDREGEDAK